ncbi:VWA domain-containing protein [Pseudomonas oryzihabitans]|uniref:VWA domain-containing protein n=1 Tax=Pseudomonas oryzihabitans TaxID=47885 RepID=UPI0028956F97|nr:VWA domain-containing protein [Pseudomonas oryzihabitans]MDT3719779.1 VWA domain-containing protein [Pseudomonas oryzihabitans]
MFEFAWPWLWLLAPLPWLLRQLLPVADSGQAALRVDFLGELQHLGGRSTRPGSLTGVRRLLPFLLGWLLILAAAARPQWVGPPQPLDVSGRDLLLAVDVSGSMDTPDMQLGDENVSRLTLVRQLLGRFIDSRQGDRVGLILFGSQAYLQAPLTADRRTVHALLEEAQIGLAGRNTAVGDAVGLAVKHLRKRPDNSRTLILVTDGASNGGVVTPEVAATLAASERVRVYTLGIGAEPDTLAGGTTSSDLDEPMLRHLAELTNGAYFRVRSSAELAAVSRQLDRLEPIRQQPDHARPTKELYPWPLALALLLGLTLTLARLPLPDHWRRLGRRR